MEGGIVNTNETKSYYYKLFNGYRRLMKKQFGKSIGKIDWIGTKKDDLKFALDMIRIRYQVEKLEKKNKEIKKEADRRIAQFQLNNYGKLPVSITIYMCIKLSSSLLRHAEKSKGKVFFNTKKIYKLEKTNLERKFKQTPKKYTFRKLTLDNTFVQNVNSTPKVNNIIKNAVKEYNAETFGKIKGIRYIMNVGNHAVSDWLDMVLKGDINYLNAFVNVISKLGTGDNCVVSLLERKNIFNKHKDLLNKLSKSGVSIKELIDFFTTIQQKTDFTYGIYDGSGELKYGVKDANFNCICMGNHIHYVDGKYLKKRNAKNIVIESDLYNKMIKYLDDGKIPSNVYIDGVYDKTIEYEEDPLENGVENVQETINCQTKPFVYSFEFEDNKYVDNDKYTECKTILTKLNINENIAPDIFDVGSLTNILSNHYCQSNTKSYCFPYKYMPIIPIYRCNDKQFKESMNDNLVSIDANSAYSNILKNIPYLVTFDFLINKINNYTNQKIKEHFLYFAKLIKCEDDIPNILMSKEGIYTGEHLIKCKKYGFEFEILKEIETGIAPNYYYNMIDDLEKFCGKDVKKEIVNIMIGKMSKNFNKISPNTNILDYITTNDEVDRLDGVFTKTINDKFIGIKKNIAENICLYNQLPIYLQVRHQHNMNIYETMKTLNINKSNLVQLRIDSITFNNEENDVIEYAKNNNYKMEDLNTKKYFKNQVSIISQGVKDIYGTFSKSTYTSLQTVYAGVGKTTLILNTLTNNTNEYLQKLMPDADEETIKLIKYRIEKNDYIILTPTHEARQPYTQFNNNVITHFVESNQIPKENLIIIDEIGMTNNRKTFNLLLKCKMLYKNIICVGDFKQLPTIGTKFILPDNVKNFIFCDTTTKLNTNHRNNFTETYYNEVLHMTQKNLINEVNKYSTKTPYEAEMIITYRNDTKDKYNMLIANKLGYAKNGKAIIKKGLKLRCITNKYKHMGVYNRNKFIISEVKDDIIHFENTTFTIPKKILFNKVRLFDLDYAGTIYSIEGKSIKSYYWATEDNDILQKSQNYNNIGYTIISRLKTL